MYPNYKRPRFTEQSDDEEEEQSKPAVVNVNLDTMETLRRTYPVVPPRKRPRFTEESDDDEEQLLTKKETIGGGCQANVVSPLWLLKKAPATSILKQPSIPRHVRPSRRDPPSEPEYRKVFISNIDAARPAEEVKETLLNLMKTHGIPCEQKVHILPPNIGGRHHRGVAWITLEHQDDIDKAINRLSKTMFGTRIMKAKVHENPMLYVTKAQASATTSIPTFAVRRGGLVPTPIIPQQSIIPPWQKKSPIPTSAPWQVKKGPGDAKKIFIWNIDNNKNEEETKAFLFQILAAEFGGDVVESVSVRSKGIKAYAFVEFTRSTYVTRALEIVNGKKFGIKHLGAQVHQSRQQGSRHTKDLDFNPW